MEKKVVLIIDDSAVDTRTYKRYLSTFPPEELWEIHNTTTGEEALSLYPSLQPDCVLMDYRLPDTDGLALLTQLQAIAPKETLCVVLITGSGSERLAVQALQEGALDYLIKQDITPERLGKAVRNAITRNELRQQVARQQQQLVEINQQLKQSLDALEESEKRFRVMTNTIPQIVWTATPDGKLDYFSQQWYDYSHYNYQQSKGLGWTSAIHPADWPRLSEQWSYSLRTGQLHQVQARMRRSDGVYRWQLIQAHPLRSQQGAITQWMGTCTDLQDQKQTEQDLKALAEELTASNEELGEANKEIQSTNEELGISNGQLTRTNVDLDNFIYTASHDLKGPISNIESLLSALLRTLPPESLASERAQRITSLMQESVERFKKTIESLTDVVKLRKENSGEAVLGDLSEVIREVSLDLALMIQSSGAQVSVDVAGCPSVSFSEKNLRSVVYNLLSNALKYRSPERVTQVGIHCGCTPEYHVLTVADNGLGMEARHITSSSRCSSASTTMWKARASVSTWSRKWWRTPRDALRWKAG